MTKTIQKIDTIATPMESGTYDEMKHKVKPPYLNKLRQSYLKRSVGNRLANRASRLCPAIGCRATSNDDAARDHSVSENRLAALALAAVASRYPLGPNVDSQRTASTRPLHSSEPSLAKSAKPSHLLHRLQFVTQRSVQSQSWEANIASSFAIDSVDYADIPFNHQGNIGRAYLLIGNSLTAILRELDARSAA